jgi:hypothetical protein
VKGLDAIYIGPSDLSLALGCTPTFDDVDKPVALYLFPGCCERSARQRKFISMAKGISRVSD